MRAHTMRLRYLEWKKQGASTLCLPQILYQTLLATGSGETPSLAAILLIGPILLRHNDRIIRVSTGNVRESVAPPGRRSSMSSSVGHSRCPYLSGAVLSNLRHRSGRRLMVERCIRRGRGVMTIFLNVFLTLQVLSP